MSVSDPLPSTAYRALFRSLPGAYILFTPDAVILDSTDAHAAISQQPRERTVGRSLFDAYPSSPEQQQPLRDSHARVRTTLQPDTMPLIRYDLVQADGTLEARYWQITHHPVLAPDGSLQYILQMPADVTVQHLASIDAQTAAAALAEMQEQTNFTLEALPVLVWIADVTGHITYANLSARQFTGHVTDGQHTIAESLGQIHPDDRAHVAAARQRAAATGTAYQLEYRLRRHDGQYRWLLARGVPRHDAHGHVRMWVGCALDNQEQRQLVEELLTSTEAQAALGEQAYQAQQNSESQRRALHDLLMEAPALIAIGRGADFVFDFVNPLYAQLFPSRQLLGRALAEAIPEAVEQGFVTLAEGVYRTGVPFRGQEMRFDFPAEKGQLIRPAYFNFTYQPFRENGQIVGVLSFAFEVTELVEARQQLERQLGTPPAQ